MFWVLARGAAASEVAFWAAAVMKGAPDLGRGPGPIATDAAQRQLELERDLERARLIAHAAGAAPGVLAREAGNVAATVYQSVAPTVVQFRRGGLPRVTGTEQEATLQEMIADFVAGARVPVGSVFPPPWEPNGVLRFLGFGIVKLMSQLWGHSNNSASGQLGPPETTPAWWPTGTMDPGGWNEVSITWTRTTLNPYDGCSQNVQYQPGSWGYNSWGTRPITVREENPLPYPGSCGQVVPGDAVVWGGWPNGPDAEMARIHTSEHTSYIAVTGIAVRPGSGMAGVPYPDFQPAAVPRPGSGRLPIVPAVAPAPVPAVAPEELPQPAEVPGAVPVVAPAVPAVKPAAAPGRLPSLPALMPAAPAVGREIRPDGVVAPAPAQKPATTPGNQEIPWPGGQPIGSPAQQPRPTLAGIASEVGRIEKKLAQMNTPRKLPHGVDGFDWADALQEMWEFFRAINSGGSYSLWSPCVDAGQPGSASDPMKQNWGGSLGSFAALEKKLDAIAGLLQDGKVLPQPTCTPPAVTPTGMPIVVRFVSDEVSPYGEKPLRKILSYRSQSGVDLQSHTDHWAGFTWTSGTWMVLSQGLDWGQPQVWAESPEEGRRVLQHAAAIAGMDLSDPKHQFVVRPVQSARISPNMLMHVKRDTAGRLWVTTRDGSAGPPVISATDPPSLGSTFDKH